MKRPHLAAFAVTVGLALASSALAHGSRSYAPPPSDRPDVVNVNPLDLPVIDQDGRTRSFRRDVLAPGRMIVMNFIFTGCSAICPVQSTVLARVQDLLGDRVGRDVRLVSMSIDPENDTPQALKEQAERYGSRPGWLWLTGKPDDVERLLGGVRALADTPGDHAGYFLVGDTASRTWWRIDGSAAPEDIVAKINRGEVSGN
ncbi:MAG TPA: SCO family protein [Azospirillum sp.]|nr:SCO family protein [Azospirillum sp.]